MSPNRRPRFTFGWGGGVSSFPPVRTLALYRTSRPTVTIGRMCTQLWAEENPKTCEGCGQRYVRELMYIGWHMTLHRRTMTCNRPGCGHEWIRPADAQLVPLLQRCRDRSCPTWQVATPSRPPIPSIAELARESGER